MRTGLRVVTVASVAVGCGGGAATLHPAHTLPQADVALGAGVSGNFAFGDVESQMVRGRSAPAAGATDEAERAFAEGAVASALIGPGVAPWAGGRVGLGADTEGDLTYAGRSVRGGARHAFESRQWAVSVGGGAAMFLLRPGSQSGSAEATAGRFQGGIDDANVTGWGLDAPIVAGYRSDGEVVQGWVGSRVGFEVASGELPITPQSASAGDGFVEVADLDGTRWYAGGMVGVAAGVSPIWVGVQLDVAYQAISGTVSTPDAAAPLELDVRGNGLTVTPTGVLWGKF